MIDKVEASSVIKFLHLKGNSARQIHEEMVGLYGGRSRAHHMGELLRGNDDFKQPLLCRKLKIHDTCGVNNLHGMPGILAGISGAILSALASKERYGYRLYEKFPARAPYTNSTELSQILLLFENVKGGIERTAAEQAGYQMAALLHSLVISVVGGLLVGKVISYPFFKPVKSDECFDDQVLWNLPESENELFPFELNERRESRKSDLP